MYVDDDNPLTHYDNFATIFFRLEKKVFQGWRSAQRGILPLPPPPKQTPWRCPCPCLPLYASIIGHLFV